MVTLFFSRLFFTITLLLFSSSYACDPFTEIFAGFPSKINKRFVEIGEFVKKGTILTENEAMKMQSHIRAPHDGFVAFLLEKDHVDSRDIICILSVSPIKAPPTGGSDSGNPENDLNENMQSPHTFFAMPSIDPFSQFLNALNASFPLSKIVSPSIDEAFSSQHASLSLSPLKNTMMTEYEDYEMPSTSKTPFFFSTFLEKSVPASLSFVWKPIQSAIQRIHSTFSSHDLLSEKEVRQLMQTGILIQHETSLNITHAFPKTMHEWQNFLENFLTLNVIAFSGFTPITTRGFTWMRTRARRYVARFAGKSL